MSKEETIKTLKKLKSFHNGSYGTAIDEAIKALEQESITWIVGKDNCQVAVRNMPIDKMKKICAVIGEEEQQPCEDCVSRENALNGLIATDLKGWQLAVALEAIEKLSPVTPQPKTGEWILCDTQLPPKDKNVLVTRMYKGKPYVEIAEWNDGWTSYSDEYKVDYFTEHQVVAWMPLPAPYQPPKMMCEED